MPRIGALVAIASVLFGSTNVGAQSIFTLAGGGTDDGRPANAVALSGPTEVVADRFGNLFVSETGNHRVRRISLTTGLITTVAGNGSAGYTGDGGPATAASLDHPKGMAVDRDGALYVIHDVSPTSQVARRVDPQTGIISTYAGGGVGVGTGDGGPATQAGVSLAERLALDSEGNLFIGEITAIRRVDARTGIISTYAGGFSFVRGLAFDGADNLFIVDSSNFRIRRLDRGTRIMTTVAGNGNIGTSGDGGPATLAALTFPEGIVIDASGNFFIGSGSDHRVRRVDAMTGIITTVAGRSSRGFSGDGGAATSAQLNRPIGVALDDAGNLYIAEFENHRVRRVDAVTRKISTFAGSGAEAVFVGDGGPATASVLALGSAILPAQSSETSRALAVGPDGSIYFADTNHHRVRRINSSSRRIETVAGNGVRGFGGDGGPATSASLQFPTSVATAPSGVLYIADNRNYRIRRVALDGTITTVVGSGTTPPGTPPADGLPATQAFVSFPNPMAVDANGRLLFAANAVVWRVNDAGLLERVAGTGSRSGAGDGSPATTVGFDNMAGLALDRNGNLFISTGEDSVSTGRVRRVDAVTGIAVTVAGGTKSGPPDVIGDGGPATAARINPAGIAVDEDLNLWISGQSRIRRVDAATGIINTRYGTGRPGWLGDGGPASAAGFALPTGIAFNAAGDLAIVDADADRLRVVFKCVTIGPPALSSPSEGSSGVATAPLLRWQSVAGALRYDVYVDKSSPPETRVAEDLETTAFAPANLQPLTKYFWRIVAKGDPFCVPYSTNTSAVRSFTTRGGCTPPEGFDTGPP